MKPKFPLFVLSVLILAESSDLHARKRPVRKAVKKSFESPMYVPDAEDLIQDAGIRALADERGGDLRKEWFKPTAAPVPLKTYRFVIEGSEIGRPRNYQYFDPEMQEKDKSMRTDGFKGTLYKASEGKNIFCTQTTQIWPEKKPDSALKANQIVVHCLGKELDEEHSAKLYPYSSWRDPNAKAFQITDDCPALPEPLDAEVATNLRKVQEQLSRQVEPVALTEPLPEQNADTGYCASTVSLPATGITLPEKPLNADACAFDYQPPVVEAKNSCLKLDLGLLVPKADRNAVRVECQKKGSEKSKLQLTEVTADQLAKGRLLFKEGAGEYDCKVVEYRKREQGFCGFERKFTVKNEDGLPPAKRHDLLPSELVPGTSVKKLEEIEREVLVIRALENPKDGPELRRQKAILTWFRNFVRPIPTRPQSEILSREPDRSKHHSVDFTWDFIQKNADGTAKSLGYAHCQQYALLSCTFARTMGIPCRVVTAATASGAGHGWAELEIDGKTWFLDAGNGILFEGSRDAFLTNLRLNTTIRVTTIHAVQDYQR